ncbi:chorismate--pyruvate lyase family protein [Echinimonas agarilytica]|uniref:Chorismate pyruvate-lyase family protein n=1 Tax=Echinimonas agarilytica TaxID=1215918 RepID=A0AA41WA74_9GAMM|nr:chorismate pyruvate-lyase family protein [Echinimonas agarilytica]MCM2681108.1 chorismate pyruvate-lyase family protein [Echinimonas agarilytica]
MTCYAHLPSFLKVLITSDGTVTNMLEAWFAEAIHVEVEQESTTVPEHDLVLLNAAPGDHALCRTTQVKGKTSGVCYLNATAVVLPNRVPQATLDCIGSHEAGIGKALRQTRSETLREVLDWGVDDDEQIAWRCYRIVMSGQPVMLITERFPIAPYLTR